MRKYISSFPNGFEEVVVKDLSERLINLKILRVFKGLIYYEYSGDIANINRVIYLNNSYIVYRIFKGKNLSFINMISEVNKRNIEYNYKNTSSFRIRFSLSNTFSKVEKKFTRTAENKIVNQTRMWIDRLNPKTEFWYMIRTEGVGFYCQLIKKRRVTEKNLNKGELRPEFAYLLTRMVDISEVDTVLDPFAGYGSIPKQIDSNYRYKKLIASDINQELVIRLRKSTYSKKDRVTISCMDALNMKELDSNSVSKIVTDPPWGIYSSITDEDSFYKELFSELYRVCVPDAELVILTSRKNIIIVEYINDYFTTIRKLEVLVNGKKSTVYHLKKTKTKKYY